MRKYETKQIRNLALIGHGGGGKSSLAEAMLFRAGALERLGSVEAGTSISDSDPEEQARKTSINLSLLPFEWEGCKLNLLDAPGYADFSGETAAGLAVADSFLLVVDAVAGLQADAMRYWEQARSLGLPGIIVVNRLDKENADFRRVVQQAREYLGVSVLPLSLPFGDAAGFTGYVDVLTGKAFQEDAQGVKEASAPAGVADQIASAKEALAESAAEAEEELTNRYLEGESLSDEETRRGLRKQVLSGAAFLALPSAATGVLGTKSIFDAIIAYLPSPEERPVVAATDKKDDKPVALRADESQPLAALVFKTMTDPYAGRLSFFRTFSGALHGDANIYNSTRETRERVGQVLVMKGRQQEAVPSVSVGDIGVIAKLRETLSGDTLCDEARPVIVLPPAYPQGVYAVSIRAKSKVDEDKLGSALARLVEEDPTLRYSVDPQTRETILNGLGDLQVEIAIARLKRRFSVEVETGVPKIPYRETIRTTVSVQGKYKKQTGGRGQYGDVWVRFEPMERGSGFEFANEITGGVVPRNYVPAVEKGIREAMERGVIAGYPLTDMKAAIYDGSYHSVDSSDMAFKIAGSMALQKATLEAQPCLLEPVVSIEVVVPESNMGDVMGGLDAKRGRIIGLESQGGSQVVKALVPLAEIASYATELRSMTGGRGSYSLKLSHYEEVPPHIAQTIIEKANQEKEKEK